MRAARLDTKSYHVYVPSFGDWGFHMASAAGEPRWSEKVGVATKYLNPAVLRASLSFGGDAERIAAPKVNSLLQPVLQGWWDRLREPRQPASPEPTPASTSTGIERPLTSVATAHQPAANAASRP